MALPPLLHVPTPPRLRIRTWKASPSPGVRQDRTRSADIKRCQRADLSIQDQLAHMYDDMEDYDRRYPAAVQVRNTTGRASWEKLESYRWFVIEFTIWMRQLDRDKDLKVDESSLDRYLPQLQDYVFQTWGKSIEEKFQLLHNDLVHVECIVDEGHHGNEMHIQVGDPAKNIQEMFRRKPLHWFVYNLYFPTEVRMSWQELMAWAVESLQRDPMEPLYWTTKLLMEEQVRPQPPPPNRAASRVVLDRAKVEMCIDLQTRFGPLPIAPIREFPQINDDYLGNGVQRDR